MTFNFRGCGDSEGDFSLQGWVDDLRNAISHLLALHEPSGVILLGTNTGGSIAICVAADDPRVSAAGLLSPRADFDDWAEHPRRFLEHAREIGAIHDRRFPPSVEEWAREFRRFRPVASARRFAPRPLLVMHGEDDDSVPGVRRPPARQRPRQRRAEPVRGRRPPAAPRPAGGGGAARLARPGAVDPRAPVGGAGVSSPAETVTSAEVQTKAVAVTELRSNENRRGQRGTRSIGRVRSSTWITA